MASILDYYMWLLRLNKVFMVNSEDGNWVDNFHED